MIYLDYSATTPVLLEVTDAMNKVAKDYIGNPNSLNGLGRKSNALLHKATNQVSELLGVNSDELIFTSGATESNNLAFIGTAMSRKKKGNHIIISHLEHPSVYEICDHLKINGFEISYVDNGEDGIIDLEHLKSLIRSDTILVSICAVNSELGIKQPLKIIRQFIKKQNSDTYFHSDITQALGKLSINLGDVDLASASAHKIYGPKGIGLLYKSKDVILSPILHGSGKFNKLRPGTPPLPLIVGFSKAIRICLVELDKRNSYVERLNERIVNDLKKLDDVLINKTSYCVPQILNISFLNIMPETLIRAMDAEEIYLSTNTACSSGEISSAIMSIYNDERRAGTSIRISLSYMTTFEEVKKFLLYLNNIYDKLNNL